MRITLNWGKPIMEWNYYKEKDIPSKFDKEHITLEVGIKGLSKEKSYMFLNDLGIAINNNEDIAGNYGKTEFSKCCAYEDVEENALHDECYWKRDYGYIREQKKEIMQNVRKICKELKKKYE